MRRPRHAAPSRVWRRILRVAVFGLAGLLVVGSGGAYAAFKYEESNAERILPGVRIGGVDVGDLSRAQAIAKLREVTTSELDREIEVTAGDGTWRLTPAEVGMVADVEAKVQAALSLGSELPWHERAIRRLLDRPLEESFRLRYSRQGQDVNRFLKGVADDVYVSPSDARIDMVDGQLRLTEPRKGAELDVEGARSALRRALRGGAVSVGLPLRRIAPEIGVGDLGKTIVVRLSENRLYVYDGLQLTKTYEVATGKPGYTTPVGTWTIWDKRENPTWVNPAPDGWGKGLPAVIGPGPGNPLGTHALYLDAPGIRIHGTYAENSIGGYASHGCVRMRLADSRELFEIIPVGTKVHVLA
jgi:hypothetical protein